MENVPFGLLTRMAGSSGGDLSITNGAKVTITGASMGTYPQGDSTLTVDSSTVEIGAESWGLYWPGPIVLKDSTVICTTNNSAIGTGNEISYQYSGGYAFLAGDTADASKEIGQSEQKEHLTDKYVKIAPVTVSDTEDDSEPTYTITLPDKTPGGQVKVSRRYAEQGATVTITVTPDEGYACLLYTSKVTR